jgi:ketosteroid isomerase-like protein
MTDVDFLAFAEHFVTSIERGDAAAVRACYAPDAKLWHNTDGIEQTVDQNMKLLDWYIKTMTNRHYRILRRVALADGFMQMHVLEATQPDGAPFKLDACVVVQMKNGVITRLDEYLDSAQTAVLQKFGRRA